MMRRSIAFALLAALVVAPGVRASTPDDAWVARFVARVTDPAIYDVKPRTIERYFDGIFRLRALGDDKCPKYFEATDRWPTLKSSWFDFADAKTCDTSPLGNVKIDFLGDDAPEVAPLLEALGKRLGKPTQERVIKETNVASTMWGTRTRGVAVEYDAGNPRGYTVWIFGSGSTSKRS